MRPTIPPVPTSTIAPDHECEPFPDEIYTIIGGDFFVRCGNNYTFLTTPDILADVTAKGHWDYTPRTGRIAYWFHENSLYVYDFWTDQNNMWLEQELISAAWSPLSSSEAGLQQLAILQADGQLKLIISPNETTTLANIGEACCLSWSPEGDVIAYIRHETLYVFDMIGAQIRKLAEEVSGTPVWALEQGAIIVSDAPIRIVKLDGSGSFTPNYPDGTKLSGRAASKVL